MHTWSYKRTAASSFQCSQLKRTEEWDVTWKHSCDTHTQCFENANTMKPLKKVNLR